jgi:hypothetical protein
LLVLVTYKPKGSGSEKVLFMFKGILWNLYIPPLSTALQQLGLEQ